MESGASPNARTKVLYVGGSGRSGSTLLTRLLGEMPGVVAVGEISNVWSRNYVENQLCGCGLKFHDCGFWRDVTRKAFGCDPTEVPVRGLAEKRHKAIGDGHNPQLWLPMLRSGTYQAVFNEYSEILGDLYRAIQTVSGAKIVADSSKEPSHALVLQSDSNIDLHMVHLVRDSRAVAYSWRKIKVRPEVHWKVDHMRRYSAVHSALEWNARNVLTRNWSRSWASYTVLRYEDLVADPKSALARIGDAIGEDWGHGVLPLGAEIQFRTSHTASGNPARFDFGHVQIRRDDEWQGQMRLRDNLIVSSLTASDLVRYGYPVWQHMGRNLCPDPEVRERTHFTHQRSPRWPPRPGRSTGQARRESGPRTSPRPEFRSS
jgi:hypothetical protein